MKNGSYHGSWDSIGITVRIHSFNSLLERGNIQKTLRVFVIGLFLAESWTWPPRQRGAASQHPACNWDRQLKSRVMTLLDG